MVFSLVRGHRTPLTKKTDCRSNSRRPTTGLSMRQASQRAAAGTTSLRHPRRRVRVVAATTSLGEPPEAGASDAAAAVVAGRHRSADSRRQHRCSGPAPPSRGRGPAIRARLSHAGSDPSSERSVVHAVGLGVFKSRAVMLRVVAVLVPVAPCCRFPVVRLAVRGGSPAGFPCARPETGPFTSCGGCFLVLQSQAAAGDGLQRAAGGGSAAAGAAGAVTGAAGGAGAGRAVAGVAAQRGDRGVDRPGQGDRDQ